MRKPAEVWQAIKGVFVPFPGAAGTVMFVVELLFFAVIVYMVLRTLWENNARPFIIVYLLLLVAAGAISFFAVPVNATAFIVFFLVLSLFFLFLFNVELKRAIWNAGKHKLAANSSAAALRSASSVTARADEYIGAIVKAVQNLSKNDIGALIVLSNGNLPKAIIESGVTLNASISSQLIEGIFIPKAPLHDGAMVIFGDVIEAAGCFLPLTQKDYPKEYGTRHRAGIGVTEVADVSTIIVSEETGIVSIVKRGEITRFVDSEGLKRFLKEYYWKEFNGEGKKQ